MTSVRTTSNPLLAALSAANLRRYEKEIHSRTDHMFAWVMAFQYFLAIIFALVISPRTWSGASQSIHPHLWTAVLLGGCLAGFPIYHAIRFPGATYTRHVVAVSQALFSALLIHVTGGRVETHFHIFGSLAFLAFYRDWRVLVSASAIVALDHILRGIWFPASVYGVASGAEWRFLEHAGWVVFEDIFLIVACVTSIREMQSLALRQAELETAKEHLERVAAEANQQSVVLNSVLSGMTEGVIVTDVNGEFLHFNPAAKGILGEKTGEIPVTEWLDAYRLYAEDGVTPYTSEDLPLARALRGESIELPAVKLERLLLGDEVYLEISSRPLSASDDRQIGGVVVFRDVTLRRQMLEESARARQEAERANAAKSEFLSRMSHELRTPMNAILGFSQILQMDDLTEDQSDSLNQIVRGGNHLLKLINEILDIAGIEAGRLSISKEPVGVSELIREVVGMVQPLLLAKKIQLHWEQDADTAFAFADHQRLLQIMINLVSNAIKYNVPEGQVWIRIESIEDRVRILVEDTGIGIPPEKESLLFSPFERLGAQNTTVEGTGLGLSLTKNLTEAMGGTIGLLPREEGSCFYVDFPKAECPLRVLESADWKADEASASAVEAEATILLIEDNPANVRLMEKMLQARPGHRLIVARQGKVGVVLARQVQPTMVLLDLDLPDIKGHEVLRQLREDATTRDLPVIVVSADATPSHFQRLMAAGATQYLTKPIDVRSFLSLIDETCAEPEKSIA